MAYWHGAKTESNRAIQLQFAIVIDRGHILCLYLCVRVCVVYARIAIALVMTHDRYDRFVRRAYEN